MKSQLERVWYALSLCVSLPFSSPSLPHTLLPHSLSVSLPLSLSLSLSLPPFLMNIRFEKQFRRPGQNETVNQGSSRREKSLSSARFFPRHHDAGVFRCERDNNNFFVMFQLWRKCKISRHVGQPKKITRMSECILKFHDSLLPLTRYRPCGTSM